MNHYCTYFDRGYLPQGLALWSSLVRQDPLAVLWVLALDADTVAVLQELNQPGLKVLPLAPLLAADAELAAVRPGRAPREFIFTLTPCLLRYLFGTAPGLASLIYLDADLFFFSSPAPIHRELAGGSILIVPHRFPHWHDDVARCGRFNVGVVGFRADANARACLDWWRERCLESCAVTADGVHFGDQKYLDEWPRRFAGVVESKNSGVNLAPWNWATHRFALRPEGVSVDGAPLVVFHFAQFRQVRGRWFDSGQLEYGVMPFRLRSRIYGEYWTVLVEAEATAQAIKPESGLRPRGWAAALGPWHLAWLRLLAGQFWRRSGDAWVAGGLGLGALSGRALGLYRRWRKRAA